MNNFEKIKAMSIDEMVEFIINPPCNDIFCEDCFCGDTDCQYRIKQWLEQESEG